MTSTPLSPTSPTSPISPSSSDYSTLTEGERLLLKDLDSQLNGLIPYAEFLNKFEKDLRKISHFIYLIRL